MDIKIKVLPKECPFCHEVPTLIKDPLWNDSHGYHGNYEYYVACKNIKCKINPKTRLYNDIYMTEEKCIDKSTEDWNTR